MSVLQVALETRQGIVFIRFRGKIAIADAQCISNAFERASSKGGRAIVLDLRKVSLFSCSAIGVLVTIWQRHQELALICQGLVGETLHVSQVDRLMPIFDSDDTVLKYFGVRRVLGGT